MSKKLSNQDVDEFCSSSKIPDKETWLQCAYVKSKKSYSENVEDSSREQLHKMSCPFIYLRKHSKDFYAKYLTETVNGLFLKQPTAELYMAKVPK